MDAKGAIGKEATRDNANAWTVEVPFQYVFVEAEARRTDLDLENAIDFIEKEFETLCRVTLHKTPDEDPRSMTGVSAWQLLAPCPFSHQGEASVLESSNWVRVHKWTVEEFDAAVESEDDYIQSHAADIKTICDDLGPSRVLMNRFFGRSLAEWGAGEAITFDSCSEAGLEQNVYGLNLSELVEALSDHVESDASESRAERLAYGVEGYFGGLYRCPHCGGIFAVVFRDSCNPRRRGRYEMLSLYSDTLDKLTRASSHAVQAKRISSIGKDIPHVSRVRPTMSVEVKRFAEDIVLTTNIAGIQHQLAFNTGTGTFLLDGSSYAFGFLFRIRPFFQNPFVWSGLFGVRELVERVSRLLPPLPEGVGMRFGPGQSFRNLFLLIAANRFIGYPSSFYEESSSRGFPWSSYSLSVGLPREYSELPRFYEKAGLPGGEAIKRVLFNRPNVLLEAARAPGLPFSDTDMLCRFFELPAAGKLLLLVNPRQFSCLGWRWLGSVKGEEAVFDFLVTHSRETINDMSELLEDAGRGFVDLALKDIANLSIEDIGKELKRRKRQDEPPCMNPD